MKEDLCSLTIREEANRSSTVKIAENCTSTADLVYVSVCAATLALDDRTETWLSRLIEPPQRMDLNADDS